MCLTPKGDGAQLTLASSTRRNPARKSLWLSGMGRFLQLLSRGVAVIYKIIISSSAAFAHCFIKNTFVNITISGKGKTSQDSEGSDQLSKHAQFLSAASPPPRHFQLMEGQIPAMFLRSPRGNCKAEELCKSKFKESAGQ